MGACRGGHLLGKYCLTSTTKRFSTISLIRIVALLDGRVDDVLHISREKIGISQIFMGIWGSAVGQNFGGSS